MEIRVLRPFCIRFGVDLVAGDVIEASRLEAAEAIALGRAVIAEPESEPAPEAQSAKPATPGKWGRGSK